MTERDLHHATFVPLYGFSSDAEAIQLADGIVVEKFCDIMPDSGLGTGQEFADFCRLFPPSFLLCKVLFNKEGWLNFVEGDDGIVAHRKVNLESEYEDVFSWVEALRLFKPGVFRIGGLWSMAAGSYNNDVIVVPHSLMHPENGTEIYDRVREVGYKLESDEVPFLSAFREKLKNPLKAAIQDPRFAVGLNYFKFSFNSKGQWYQFIDLVVCLEALFSGPGDAGELTRTLALRVASLLGVDADERRRIFGELKTFYAARSKVLHGVPLKEKQLKELDQLPRLREVTRKGLLAALALGTDVGFGSEYFAALDEILLDDDRRREFQEKASKLLFMDS